MKICEKEETMKKLSYLSNEDCSLTIKSLCIKFPSILHGVEQGKFAMCEIPNSNE